MRAFFCLIAILCICACASQERHPDEAGVRAFLERYFSTWSAQDMDGYASCFTSQARVAYVNKGGNVDAQGLTDFLHGQKMSHQTADRPMKEVPVTMKISGDERVAQAAVSWKLTRGEEEETGMDYFTLAKTAAGWRIVSLAFFMDEKKEEK